MKKLFLVSITALLLLALVAGCGQKKPEAPSPAPSDGALKDGTYNAVGDEFDDHGWKGLATVVVKGGKVTAAFFDEINEEGLLKSFDTEYNPKMKGVSGAYPMDAYQTLEKGLVAKQSADKVDAVSGATSSSDNFKALMAKALAGNPEASKGTYTDGVYKAVAKDFDERGWRGAAAVVVEEGKIVSAYFDEYNKDALYKSVDEDYAKNMEDKTGTTPAKAADALTKSLVAKQDAASVDAVSGATGTHDSFKALAADALSHAK